MFSLDHAIADWRRQMAAGGVMAPAVLDELESHLRDDIEQQMRLGTNAQQAFETSSQHIGQAGVLKREFAKVGATREIRARMKRAVLTLAGIPDPSLATSMNTSSSNINLEPRWATYLKAAAFLAPAVVLWVTAYVWMFPKLNQVCREAGVAMPAIYEVTALITQHTIFICPAIILLLVVLERRSGNWPKYRRASIGLAVFLLNATVLVLITLMVLLALISVPALAQHAK